MNINVAAWGRLIKNKNVQHSSSGYSHHEPIKPSLSVPESVQTLPTMSSTSHALSPLTPGPRMVVTRLDFDSEKTPGEERHCRPLAMSEVRPLNMGGTTPSSALPLASSPPLSPPPPSITHMPTHATLPYASPPHHPAATTTSLPATLPHHLSVIPTTQPTIH